MTATNRPATADPTAKRAAERAAERAALSTRTSWRHPLILVLTVAIALGVVALVWQAWPRSPGGGSAEAGFARDMATHHDQAVAMALIIRDRTQDEQLRALATDIVLTQRAQIGMLQGWLDLWGLPQTGRAKPMAWMGHPTDGRMPGMASPEEVASLSTLPLPQAEGIFLELMIRHHAGGIAMAQGILARTDRAAVRRLAQNIVDGQRYEIDAMQQFRQKRGLPAVDTTPPGMDSMGHGG